MTPEGLVALIVAGLLMASLIFIIISYYPKPVKHDKKFDQVKYWKNKESKWKGKK